MHYRSLCVGFWLLVFAAVCPAGQYVVTVEGENLLLNCEPVRVIGLRCSNALISDETAQQLIDHLDAFASFGVNTVSVYFMGSRFGDVKGYREDGSLEPAYAERMGRIIEAADERGTMVLVGCLYWGNSKAKWLGWGQEQANAAVANTVRWLRERRYRNVFVDVDNEGMARREAGFDNRAMAVAGKREDPTCVIATNFRGEPPAEADLGIHFAKPVEGKPYVESEATPGNAPGGYWGEYSKRDGYYNYIRIGEYTEAMKENQIRATDEHLGRGHGYMLASTWLQAAPPLGPNQRPGGDGSADDPGVRWWLEHVRAKYGPWRPPTPVATVGQWERFERRIEHGREYDDPFGDVELEATWTGPDGRRVEFPGFYAGGRTWAIRFMPDAVGVWEYEARFSDGSGEISGEFTCMASDTPGVIGRDEVNPWWFGHRGGGHVLLRSFHAGDRFFASNWPREERAAFLDWAQGQGYNMLSVASFLLNRDSQGRGRGWETPDLWDAKAGRPRPGEYDRLEGMLDELSRRRMVVYPFAGLFGRDSDFPGDGEGQRRYVRYTLSRLGPYWNLLWNVAGPEPLLKGRPFLSMEELERLAGWIDEADPFDHLISVHNRTGDDAFLDKAFTDYTILQGPKTTDRDRLYRGLMASHKADKPLYAQETLWAGNKYHPQYTLDDLRKNAYVLLMAGATINLADNDGNSSSGFSGSLDLTDRSQAAHDAVARGWDFFETIPFWRMSPAPGRVEGGYCLADGDRQLLVYLPEGGSTRVRVELEGYVRQWIDPSHPDKRRMAQADPDGRFVPPAGGNDWLLLLTRTEK